MNDFVKQLIFLVLSFFVLSLNFVFFRITFPYLFSSSEDWMIYVGMLLASFVVFIDVVIVYLVNRYWRS